MDLIDDYYNCCEENEEEYYYRILLLEKVEQNFLLNLYQRIFLDHFYYEKRLLQINESIQIYDEKNYNI